MDLKRGMSMAIQMAMTKATVMEGSETWVRRLQMLVDKNA